MTSRKRTPRRTPSAATTREYSHLFDTYQHVKDKLTRNERKVWDYFLRHPDAVYQSITEVVKDSSVGYGTIIRFCQKMGCRGFQDYKVLMAQSVARSAQQKADGPRDPVMRYVQKVRDEILATAKLQDQSALVGVCESIAGARHVLVTGLAGSSPLAIGFDYLLSRIGISSTVVPEGYTLAIRAALLEKGDVFFAISFSGATKDILAAAGIAKDRGATVISLTNFRNAPLVEQADYSLFTATDPDPVYSEISINIAGHMVLEIVFQRLYEMRPGSAEIVARTFKAISDRRI
jgi:DNA-binding MurR/RpiR family transcriptional regulator